MKYLTRNIIQFVSCSLIGAGVTIYFSIFCSIIAAQTTVPTSVMPCFPKVPLVSRAQLSNVVKEKQIIYYLMSSDQSEAGTDLLISVERRSDRCKLLLFNPMGDTLPLSRFVPMSVARQFAIQQVKQGLAKAGSRQKYQQQLLQVEVWTPEELWAVQQLGFITPKNIEVVAPEDIKVIPD